MGERRAWNSVSGGKFHGGCTTDKGGYLRIPFFRCNQRYRSQDGRYYFPEVWASDTGNHGKQPAGTLEDPWNFREEAGCYCGVLWKKPGVPGTDDVSGAF
jgi:hypothetical protein